MRNSYIQKLLGKLNWLVMQMQLQRYSRYQKRFDIDLSFSQAANRFSTRNELHAYAHHYFHHVCHQELREHRRYFSQQGRGFGEDAFHAMWWMIFREFRPEMCLEIGVFRGQTISLWGLIAKLIDMPAYVHGISPFSPIGDAVSRYSLNVDYLRDALDAFSLFALRAPTLLKALSTDMTALSHIKSREWDLIYIDGCHDYEVVHSDYIECVAQLKAGGILIMDDSSLFSNFIPPKFSFAGHPGPSLVVTELAMKEMVFLGAVGHNNVFRKLPVSQGWNV
ncbi:class I SAM-dependent methyltransferase [Polynucleobacter sinensis]|uniref:class I SAM-dependent methyltransferase n=1 Tax=Polynucleobacter sinensis TaxID=1743157 RepID=UPI0007858237|nr:class I SAM-dependent methyltransferase [Polynucleobacter sinensis]